MLLASRYGSADCCHDIGRPMDLGELIKAVYLPFAAITYELRFVHEVDSVLLEHVNVRHVADVK